MGPVRHRGGWGTQQECLADTTYTKNDVTRGAIGQVQAAGPAVAPVVPSQSGGFGDLAPMMAIYASSLSSNAEGLPAASPGGGAGAAQASRSDLRKDTDDADQTEQKSASSFVP